MTTRGPRRRRRGPTSNISDDEIKKLMDEGMNPSQIARYFTDRGRPITHQGIRLRVKTIREAEADRSNYLLPWAIRTEHATGFVYRAVKAYAKARRGEALNERERIERTKLEDELHALDAVLMYDYNRGFKLRNRRPDDGPSLLAKQ